MLRKLYGISAYALFIGVLHTALTPVFYPSLSPDALWFAGTGLALVFLGLLNIMTERLLKQWMLNLCIPANLLGCIWSILVVAVLPEIQAWIALVVFLAITLLSILVRLRMPLQA